MTTSKNPKLTAALLAVECPPELTVTKRMLHELTHIVGDPDDELMLEKIIATTIASIKHLERRIVNVEKRL